VNILVVTAVAAERDAIAGLPGVAVIAGGVGPSASAASTARALAADRYDLVLSAGVAGGFAPIEVGEVVVATRSVFADLGVETVGGFVSLGIADDALDADAAIAADLARRTAAATGTVLTVATVTGTAARGEALRARYPDAVAEAMEGHGVATAARMYGVPFGEVRTISNLVGPRDRTSWQLGDALAALARAFATITERL
jgi:futalosine hydrolase